jgi:hypothetical protein
VNDYEKAGRDDDQGRSGDGGSGAKLPGGISMQAVATLVLVVVVAAILWLLFVPESDTPPGLPTEPPQAVADQDAGSGTPVAIGSSQAESTSVTGTQEAPGAGTGTSSEGTPVTPVASAPSGPTVSGAGIATTVATSPAASVPGNLATGAFVRVSGTGIEGIRYRYGPGLDYVTIRIVPEGEVLLVKGGPEEGDGLVWWRLQDQLGNIGWAAQDYLTLTPAPAAWNPPPASPTFEKDASSGGQGSP